MSFRILSKLVETSFVRKCQVISLPRKLRERNRKGCNLAVDQTNFISVNHALKDHQNLMTITIVNIAPTVSAWESTTGNYNLIMEFSTVHKKDPVSSI